MQGRIRIRGRSHEAHSSRTTATRRSFVQFLRQTVGDKAELVRLSFKRSLSFLGPLAWKQPEVELCESDSFKKRESLCKLCQSLSPYWARDGSTLNVDFIGVPLSASGRQ